MVNDRAAIVAGLFLASVGAFWYWRSDAAESHESGASDFFQFDGFLSSVDSAIAGVAGQIVTGTDSMLSRLGAGSMSTSIDGLDRIKSHESFRAEKYRDQAGLWTIGYGHLIKSWERFDGPITEARALELLAGDLADAERAVNAGVRVPISQPMFDALVSLAFNIGGGAFAGSTVLRLVNQGDFQGAADAFAMWNKVTINGVLVVSNGLANRRASEAAYFRQGIA